MKIDSEHDRQQVGAFLQTLKTRIGATVVMEKRKVLAVLSAYFVLNLHQIINQNVVREPSFASEMDILFFSHMFRSKQVQLR